ncbi:MAG: ABC transporter permease [Bryobacteraceae bacterium]
MSLWQGCWLIAGKEFRQLARDPFLLLLVLGAPLLQLLIFGYALETRVRDLPVAVQDLDHARLSRMLLDRLAANPAFRLTYSASSEEELVGLLRSGKAKIAVQIPTDYTVRAFYRQPVALRMWVDGSDASTSAQALAAAQTIVMGHEADLLLLGVPEQERPLKIETQLLYNPEARSVLAFVPALIGILVELTVRLFISLSFVRERERGAMDLLRITRISSTALVAGKFAAGVAIGLVTAALLTTAMIWVFGISLGAPVWLYWGAMISIMLPGLGLGLWLSVEAKHAAQVLQLNFLIALPSVLLSGFLFPRSSMPWPMTALAQVLPNTWSLDVMRGMILRHAGLDEVGPAMLALTCLGLAYTGIGALRMRKA